MRWQRPERLGHKPRSSWSCQKLEAAGRSLPRPSEGHTAGTVPRFQTWPPEPRENKLLLAVAGADGPDLGGEVSLPASPGLKVQGGWQPKGHRVQFAITMCGRWARLGCLPSPHFHSQCASHFRLMGRVGAAPPSACRREGPLRPPSKLRPLWRTFLPFAPHLPFSPPHPPPHPRGFSWPSFVAST